MSRAVALLLIMVLAVPACYATDYMVGDSTGWDTSGDYTTWASGKTFKVGDSLLFVYSASHQVDEVNKADYDSCSSTSAISSSGDGNTSISLSTSGPHYFICPSANHCSLGMKLAITVSAASSPASPPSSTTPSASPSPATSPTIPSTSSPPPSASPSPATSPTIPSSSTPNTSRITPPSNNSGAMGSVKQMDALLFGASLVLALLLMG